MPAGQSFDAVLIVAFGGPNGVDDIRPFIANVLRGRPVPPQRIEQVAGHYEHFGGVSPINAITRQQADGLREHLLHRGIDLPVYIGMRNWHPYVADTLREMSEAGVRRVIGLIAAAQHSYSSCGQYKENVRDARKALIDSGGRDMSITYADSWYDHPDFIAAMACRTQAAVDRLDSALRDSARLVFTAHSLPMRMVERGAYVDQLKIGCRLVADRLKRKDWALVYQSRSGRPQDPWLEPDICDYLRTARAEGLPAAVIVPIGFICDHIEIRWDLDTEAIGVCREIGLPVERAETVNDDPVFIEMLADVVEAKIDQHRRFPPLPIVARSPS